MVANWILVVEDDADTRDAFVDILIGSGFVARGTASVTQAFDMIIDRAPALVLSDINLGDHNAGELLDMAVKILGPDAPPFVFVTGMPAWKVTSVPASVPLLRKPVSPETLVDIVGKYCRRQEGSRTPN